MGSLLKSRQGRSRERGEREEKAEGHSWGYSIGRQRKVVLNNWSKMKRVVGESMSKLS